MESMAFTELYVNDCCSENGTRMKLAVPDPSAGRVLGSQKRVWCRLYSSVIAEISACIGKIIGFTHTGTSSKACGSCSFTNASMCIGTAKRYAARTSCAVRVSNHNDPTTRFH